MSGNSVLKLVFDAPLQAYGRRAKWDRRDSGDYPSKSSVIGLIGNVMGIYRYDSYLDYLTSNLKVHVRIDKPGVFMDDFQTVKPLFKDVGLEMAEKTGYKSSKAKGKSDYTLVLNKIYLQGAIFTVYIEGSDELISKCYDAFQNPARPPYLGRKCCVPSCPLSLWKPVRNVVDIDTFIRESEIVGLERRCKELQGNSSVSFKCIIEDSKGAEASYDNLSSRGRRYYSLRRTRVMFFEKKLKWEGNQCVFE